MKTIIKNGLVITDGKQAYLDVAYEGEKITQIAEKIEAAAGDTVIDATGKMVFPGLIDSHLHYGLQGTADNFVSGSTLAAFGGVTTVVDFCTPIKEKSEKESLIAASENAATGYVDYTFHAEVMGWYPWNEETLKEIKEFGCNSVKVYTTYGADQLNYEQIRELAIACKKYGIIVTVHAEDDAICNEQAENLKLEGTVDYKMHAVARPAAAEILAIGKVIDICRETGARIHIDHVSTGEGARLIAAAREEGLPLTAETTPHYMTLDDTWYDKPEPYKYIMTPPLRKPADSEILWEELKKGNLDSIITDHCTFTTVQKTAGDTCFSTRPGIGGTETMLPVIYTYGVRTGKISVERMVSAMSDVPAKLYGLYPKKGTISVGSDADFTIFDPEKDVVATNDKMHSGCDYCVYEGIAFKGWPVQTILRGKTLVKGEELLVKEPYGQFVKADF